MAKGVFKRTEAYKEKMRSISLRNGNRPPSPRGTVWTEERKEKLRQQRKGVSRPENVKRVMAQTHFKKGHVPANKGKPHLSNEKNPAWKGGTSRVFILKNAPRPKPDQCEVCGAFGTDFKKGLCYDHDHHTGQFRGWLCTRCNVAIGMVKDNTETLTALSDYIKRSRAVSASGYKGV